MSEAEPDDPGAAQPAGSGGEIHWLESGPLEIATAPCWRCGKSVEAIRPTCPFCLARLAAEPADPTASRRKAVGRGEVDDGTRFLPVFYLYLGLFATSIGYGWTTHFGFDPDGPPGGGNGDRIAGMIVVDLINTVLVLAGIFWVTRPAAPPKVAPGRRPATWAIAPVALIALLAINVGYHRLLQDGLGLPDVRMDLLDDPKLLPWVILTICVQPAVVEELFFRYLALGHLRPILGIHGAVLISAVMFGMAHLSVLLSTPYLILAGIAFGYARVYSRGLALPMAMHFAHNFVVLWLDKWL